MVTVTADCRRVGGQTLVECRLANDHDVATRVRLESRLEGPTYPPRDDGHPVRGWTDGKWTGRLDAGETVGVGFASPAPPVASPVELAELETEPDPGPGERFGTDPTPGDVARELTDPRPPRAGLVDDDTARRTTASRSGDSGGSQAGPWLDDVTDRVERLEALDAARTVPEATVAVAEVGGLEGVRILRSATRADRERLLAVADRAERLAGRIEAADVPVETLERLA